MLSNSYTYIYMIISKEIRIHENDRNEREKIQRQNPDVVIKRIT